MATAVPTAIPSIDPYPLRTNLIFDCAIQCGNIDAFTFLDDPRISEGFVTAFASTMDNVTDANIRIRNVTDTSGSQTHIESRRLGEASELLRTNHGLHTMASNIIVAMQVKVVLEMLGYTSAESSALYNKLSTDAGSAVSSGLFGTTLASILSASGADNTIAPYSTSFTARSFSTAIEQSPRPTAYPSVIPSAEPTSSHTTAPPSVVSLTTSGSRGNTGQSIIVVIVIVTVIGNVALLAALLYGAYYEKQKALRAKVTPAPDNSIVPGV